MLPRLRLPRSSFRAIFIARCSGMRRYWIFRFDLSDPRTNRLIADVASQTITAVLRVQEAIFTVKHDDGGLGRLIEERRQKGLGGDREDAERCGRGTRCVGGA